MSRTVTRTAAFVALVLLTHFMVARPATADPVDFPIVAADPTQLAIEAALSKPIEIDFNETPLAEAAAFVSAKTKINVRLDIRSLDEIGIDGSTPVTLSVKGITLRSALNLMLKNIDPTLTFVIKDEVLLVTTREHAEEKLATRLYDVRDFDDSQQAAADFVDKIHDVYANHFPLGRDQSHLGMEDFILLIESTVEPVAWDSVGGPGSVESMSGILDNQSNADSS